MELNINNGVPGNTATAEILVDSFGNSTGMTPTYSVCVADVIPVANATDVFTISGSATKTIKITRIKISADSSSASEVDFYGYKRTTANSGGTFTNPPYTKYDSLNPNATATINLYSANPTTLGTGTLHAATQFVCTGTNGNTWNPVIPVILELGTRNNQAIVLRGANELLTVSLGGNSLPSGLNLYITIEWCEE